MADIVERLLVAIEERVARTNRVREWMGPRFQVVEFTERGAKAEASHAGWVQIAGERIWDADEDLRRCAADRKLINNVVAWPHDPCDGDPWFACAQADDGDGPGSGCANELRAGLPCDCATGAHRHLVLAALAEVYNITTEETT